MPSKITDFFQPRRPEREPREAAEAELRFCSEDAVLYFPVEDDEEEPQPRAAAGPSKSNSSTSISKRRIETSMPSPSQQIKRLRAEEAYEEVAGTLHDDELDDSMQWSDDDDDEEEEEDDYDSDEDEDDMDEDRPDYDLEDPDIFSRAMTAEEARAHMVNNYLYLPEHKRDPLSLSVATHILDGIPLGTKPQQYQCLFCLQLLPMRGQKFVPPRSAALKHFAYCDGLKAVLCSGPSGFCEDEDEAEDSEDEEAWKKPDEALRQTARGLFDQVPDSVKEKAAYLDSFNMTEQKHAKVYGYTVWTKELFDTTLMRAMVAIGVPLSSIEEGGDFARFLAALNPNVVRPPKSDVTALALADVNKIERQIEQMIKANDVAFHYQEAQWSENGFDYSAGSVSWIDAAFKFQRVLVGFEVSSPEADIFRFSLLTPVSFAQQCPDGSLEDVLKEYADPALLGCRTARHVRTGAHTLYGKWTGGETAANVYGEFHAAAVADPRNLVAHHVHATSATNTEEFAMRNQIPCVVHVLNELVIHFLAHASKKAADDHLLVRSRGWMLRAITMEELAQEPDEVNIHVS